MSIKVLLLAVTALSVSASAIAQDKIFKSNGDVLDGKIKSVGPREVYYIRADNPSGPEYSIPKNKVDKIRYQNGAEESFAGVSMPQDGGVVRNDYPGGNNDLLRQYKRNIIAFAPIQFTEIGIAGFSFSYERALDVKNIVSFYIPLITEFNSSKNDYYSGSGTPVVRNDYMIYLMPGLKIYPTGGYGIAKYAIGPSLVIANGQKTSYDYSSAPVTGNNFLFGMMVNQSINVNPTPHLYLGSEFGVGFTYVNRLTNSSLGSNTNLGTDALVQFSFKVGYRF